LAREIVMSLSPPIARRAHPRWSAPVRDPAGRFSWIKTGVLLGALAPAVVLALRWHAGALGPRPITEAIHVTGLWAIRFLMITLAVTPARAVLDWPRVVMLRRMLGVTAACYAGAHLTLYAYDQKWNLLKVASEIALRFYLTVGFVTLLGLLALAITSTNGWQRRLGAAWKRLHRIVYVLGVFALYHYAVQSKADVTEPVFVAGLFAWLMYWRREPRRWQGKLWPIPLLTLAAALSAAVAEAAWYALRNHADFMLVLQTNLDFGYGPRPAVVVLFAGGALFLAAALRRLAKRRRRMPQGAAMRRV
jgi:sulfoxide reductase heme-binding subunit YedZ